jgi:O-antigen ligase
LGTLEARIGAWESLKEAVPHYRLLGTGYGYSSYYAGRLADIEPGDIGGHNFILELVVHTGLPGMFLFLVFLWALLREGTSCLRRALEKKELIAVRWLLAFVVGYVMTGYLNGGSFMNYYFFFFCGVLAGQFSQMGPAKAAVQ